MHNKCIAICIAMWYNVFINKIFGGIKVKNLRKIITSALAISMIGIVANATVGQRAATLNYDSIKIMLDGKEIVPTDADGNTLEPFIIDGTTYLPVRGVSGALGLGVNWNAETKTVELNTPGAFSGAVEVYDDDKITIEFAGCTVEKPYKFLDDVYYYANFNIKNKTDNELEFSPSSISFDGLSFGSFSGSEVVAPKSSGKVSFHTETQIPTSGISKTSGKIRVYDKSKNFMDDGYFYEAKWVDITQ